MPEIQRNALKTGQRPVQLNLRSLGPGEVLFEEGSRGRELFIIQSGTFGVYKNTPEGRIELAQIGKNGIIGEMSLLDDLPRSATVIATEAAKALVIDEKVFKKTLGIAPVWLTSIVKIVVSRLRDTNKRMDQTALRDRERGLISLMLLLFPKHKYEFSSMTALSYDLVVVEAFYLCRLRKGEIIRIINGFESRGLIKIEEDTDRKKHLCIGDPEVLRLFQEYLNLKSEHRKFREAEIPPDSIGVLSNIAYVAQKFGRTGEDGVYLCKSVFLKEMSGKKPEVLEKSILDLRRRSVINLLPAEAGDTTIIFQPEVIARIKKIKEWLPRFTTDAK